MEWLKARLREQGTHTGIVFIALLLLAARMNGIAPSAVTAEVVELTTAIGALSALAKGALKG